MEIVFHAESFKNISEIIREKILRLEELSREEEKRRARESCVKLLDEKTKISEEIFKRKDGSSYKKKKGGKNCFYLILHVLPDKEKSMRYRVYDVYGNVCHTSEAAGENERVRYRFSEGCGYAGRRAMTAENGKMGAYPMTYAEKRAARRN